MLGVFILEVFAGRDEGIDLVLVNDDFEHAASVRILSHRTRVKVKSFLPTHAPRR